jgi:hypothetical protein
MVRKMSLGYFALYMFGLAVVFMILMGIVGFAGFIFKWLDRALTVGVVALGVSLWDKRNSRIAIEKEHVNNGR